jgi:hypothetical protein
MTKSKPFLLFLACSGAALLLACAVKIINSDTLVLSGYGLEIKAEGSRSSQLPQKIGD